MSTITNVSPYRTRLAFEITNADSKDLVVTEYYMTYPAGNGELTEIICEPHFRWQGTDTSPVDITSLPNAQKLEDGDSCIVYHMFANVPAPTGYYVKVTFDDASFAELTIA